MFCNEAGVNKRTVLLMCSISSTQAYSVIRMMPGFLTEYERPNCLHEHLEEKRNTNR